MAFESEPASYEKTVLSDLQGAWQNLRDAVDTVMNEAIQVLGEGRGN